MTPSSGARSGTKSSHPGRGAGDGKLEPLKLTCSHNAVGQPAFARRTIKWWWCDTCASFKRRR